jgi:nitroimidazol reductase NimA-like FMN-containing flavoprotein (pyridoxamine 5'-phosphate oxidase superfamily)
VTTAELVQLSRTECLDLIGQACFGRIGISVDALPVVLPVLLGRIDDGVVFRTAPGTKLALASAGAVVAVEVDDLEPSTGAGWSVLVRGVASEISDPEAIARAREVLEPTWLDERHAEHYVRVGLDLVTGRRLRR